VFAIQRRKVTFSQGDKELTVVFVRAFIGSGQIAHFSELELMVDFIVKELFVGVLIGQLPNGGGLLGKNASAVI